AWNTTRKVADWPTPRATGSAMKVPVPPTDARSSLTASSAASLIPADARAVTRRAACFPVPRLALPRGLRPQVHGEDDGTPRHAVETQHALDRQRAEELRALHLAQAEGDRPPHRVVGGTEQRDGDRLALLARAREAEADGVVPEVGG